ncbi:hypothetical protein LOAG_17463 [Loa loa]|nr:hypothetical protein LOAG_17463 [Loa loa]EJD75371.1 hypothetical protein LOAG_17463 [Loa loa]
MACEKDDIDNLNGMLTDIKGVKTEYVPFYLKTLKCNRYTTIEEIEEIIEMTNQTIDNDRING